MLRRYKKRRRSTRTIYHGAKTHTGGGRTKRRSRRSRRTKRRSRRTKRRRTRRSRRIRRRMRGGGLQYSFLNKPLGIQSQMGIGSYNQSPPGKLGSAEHNQGSFVQVDNKRLSSNRHVNKTMGKKHPANDYSTLKPSNYSGYWF